mgnify:FL=1
MTEQIEGNDSAGPEKMLSIQCKMVLCEGGQKEVVRVSIVNSDCKVINLNVCVIVQCIRNGLEN